MIKLVEPAQERAQNGKQDKRWMDKETLLTYLEEQLRIATLPSGEVDIGLIDGTKFMVAFTSAVEYGLNPDPKFLPVCMDVEHEWAGFGIEGDLGEPGYMQTLFDATEPTPTDPNQRGRNYCAWEVMKGTGRAESARNRYPDFAERIVAGADNWKAYAETHFPKTQPVPAVATTPAPAQG